MGAWLSPGVPQSARKFAKWSAIGSLTLGMLGQVAYHLLSAAHAARALWPVVVLVSSLPVNVLGFGAALSHLLRGAEGGESESASEREVNPESALEALPESARASAPIPAPGGAPASVPRSAPKTAPRSTPRVKLSEPSLRELFLRTCTPLRWRRGKFLRSGASVPTCTLARTKQSYTRRARGRHDGGRRRSSVNLSLNLCPLRPAAPGAYSCLLTVVPLTLLRQDAFK
jgi:hypothetical protein